MSDFLDRLAARVIGSEPAVAPRLRSLFEAPRQVPIMPDVGQDEAPAQHRGVPSGVVAAAAALPASAIPPATPPESERSRIAPAERLVVPTTPAAASSRSRHEASLPALAAPRQSPVIERPAAATQARQPQADPPAPVQPRQTRVAPDRQQATPPLAGGSLRPSSTPVFSTQAPAASAPPARAAHAATRPRLATRADSQREAAPDPVVHVSIGRLEVRAAAAPVAAPRRRDAPRPSSLDDYLRQRGDKVAP